MKKLLSAAMALLLILGQAAFAGSVSAENEELIPGTEFPLPDAAVSVKSVSAYIDEISEAFMRELADADLTVQLKYADQSSAQRALEEYRSKIEADFPGYTDSKGNILKLADAAVYNAGFSFNVKLSKEIITTAGKESLGWIDFSSCGDILKEPYYAPMEEYMSIASSDGRTGISIRLLEYGDQKPDLEKVSNDLLRKYTIDNLGKPMQDSENPYHDVESTMIELDRRPAFKITFWIDHPYEEKSMVLYAVYTTENAAGGFVKISASVVEDREKEAAGPGHHGIADLCAIVENTYTRSE